MRHSGTILHGPFAVKMKVYTVEAKVRRLTALEPRLTAMQATEAMVEACRVPHERTLDLRVEDACTWRVKAATVRMEEKASEAVWLAVPNSSVACFSRLNLDMIARRPEQAVTLLEVDMALHLAGEAGHELCLHPAGEDEEGQNRKHHQGHPPPVCKRNCQA